MSLSASDANLYAKMGNQAISAVSNHFLAKTQAKMQEDARDHRNVMSAISAALQQNNKTYDEIATIDQATQLKQQIAVASMQDKGNAEVNAAAAGVAGNSVDQTMRGLERSALQANFARIKNTRSQMQAHGQDRTNITLSKIYGKDVTVFQKPSVAMSLLGLGTQLLDTYNSNQPKG